MITVQVMAVANVSAADQNPIRAFLERLKNMMW